MEVNNAPEMLEVTELSVEDLDNVAGGCGYQYDHGHKPKKDYCKPKHDDCHDHGHHHHGHHHGHHHHHGHKHWGC